MKFYMRLYVYRYTYIIIYRFPMNKCYAFCYDSNICERIH